VVNSRRGSGYCGRGGTLYASGGGYDVDVSIWLNQIVKGGGGEAVSGRWEII
jgi:hypothetical protein